MLLARLPTRGAAMQNLANGSIGESWLPPPFAGGRRMPAHGFVEPK